MAKAQTVEEFLRGLAHKRIDDIQVVRRTILAADAAITERVKWNAPSFCWQGDDRVTMRLHPGERLDLIFHRGAKRREDSDFSFDDPTGRIAWAAPDRGVFRVGDPVADREAITTLVSAWIAATKDDPSE